MTSRIARAGGRPCVAITAAADSSLADAATAVVLQRVVSQRAVTHTQALAGAYGSALALWAAVTGDAQLGALLATLIFFAVLGWLRIGE